jgi:hypothetical protein
MLQTKKPAGCPAGWVVRVLFRLLGWERTGARRTPEGLARTTTGATHSHRLQPFRPSWASCQAEPIPAVLGEGTFELDPSAESERRRLAFLAGDKKLEVLTDSFESLVM